MNLKERIQKEMMSNYSTAVERHFETVKQLIKITDQGRVEILNKDNFTGEELIQLYLLGKIYAVEGGYSQSNRVNNEELEVELGKSGGSIRPWLNNLVKAGKIKKDNTTNTVMHYISENQIEQTINSILKKIGHKK